VIDPVDNIRQKSLMWISWSGCNGVCDLLYLSDCSVPVGVQTASS